MPDFDLVVVGNETEACLSAVAAGLAGARAALVVAPGALLGGLLTEDGLAFVDRDARHLLPPGASPHDGLFGRFLARAGVPLVSLPAKDGDLALRAMLAEAGVSVVEADWRSVRCKGGRVVALALADGRAIGARHFVDGTPDGDLAEACGLAFATGFREYGNPRFLGVSPLPLVHGVTPERIMATCEALGADPALDALRQKTFGSRKFLDLEAGSDYLLVGPPHLGLAYQVWREREGLAQGPYPFEADGFNVAIVGPDSTSWNGLIYFSEDPARLLALSRGGADAYFIEEAARFGRFLREGLGWRDARVELPRGIYVRQTRHVLGTRHRLRLLEIAAGYDRGSVGTFAYYPDFRGFRAVAVPGPLTAHVVLDAGLFVGLRNLGIASRAGGYTPFAHSLTRLVQYNATLGVALGVAAALAGDDLGEVGAGTLKAEMRRLGLDADDPAGFERNAAVGAALAMDPLVAAERTV